jgi:hypothetical protein
MDIEKARKINARLCDYYFVTTGIMTADLMPDISDITLEEMVTASRIIKEAPAEAESGGTKTITCHLEERAIVMVYQDSRKRCGR